MLKVENPPRVLYRITRPDLIQFDSEGNFLPHRQNDMDTYGKTVPLVHPSEDYVVLNFLYNSFWLPSEFPHFVLISFWGDKLEQLGKHHPLGLLKKHGEHFAVANISAIKDTRLCRVVGNRGDKEFSYEVIASGHFIHF